MTEPCPTCQQPHLDYLGRPGCHSHASGGFGPGARPERKGQPCRGLRMRGQVVCQKHGGKAPQNLAAAARRIEEQGAHMRLSAYMADAPDADPGEVILDLIAKGFAKVKFWRARVAELEDQGVDLEWGIVRRATGGKDKGDTYEARPHLALTELRHAEQDLRTLCIDALRVGLKQREIDIAERHGEAILRVLDGILNDLGMNPNDPKTAKVVARHLRAVGD